MGAAAEQYLFRKRVAYLQEAYELHWEDAVAIAHQLARLHREWVRRQALYPLPRKPNGSGS